MGPSANYGCQMSLPAEAHQSKRDKLIASYRARKREYESMGQTDHTEYQKITEWLKENDT